MKTTVQACTMLAVTFISHAAPLPPDGSFRLTVEQVVQSDYCRVVKLKVEARSAAEMMATECDNGFGGSVILAPILKGKGREGALTLASTLCESNSACHVITLLESRPGESSVAGHGSYDLAPGAKLESIISVSVTNGLYKLDRPLLIGKRNGEVIRLTVGSWNPKQVSRNK